MSFSNRSFLYLVPLFLEGINLVSHLLHLHEVGADVILARFDGQVLHFTVLGSVVDDQLGLHDLKCHHEDYQATRDLPPRLIICVNELDLIELEGVVAFIGGMIIQNELEGPASCQRRILYQFIRPRFLAAFGSMVLSFMLEELV